MRIIAVTGKPESADIDVSDVFLNPILCTSPVSGPAQRAANSPLYPSDPPAADILAARLRAKYWGSRYRPFIRQIMHFNFQRTTLASPVPITGDFRSDLAVPVIGPQAAIENDINPEIIEHAQKGILALIESTKSFHGLKDERFIKIGHHRVV
ncbi:hypothetical protein CONLIGDRAFT_684864 [Coniochaeta ligniaria NRRL 30616]|uniref:Uncharacterized protein n=1 Tax=Coniochaeta ligniaria NRRL 30616 TaxID=1408157 RepID=A0A1J7IC13_9PEZI|nr:hypothetical protein CONLIGDRAFT_684864 [Coniochaeta ligniaria NRRL 30616]